MKVYNYTSSDKALGNIFNARIKVSLFHNLNDPFELLSSSKKDLTKYEFIRDQIKPSLLTSYGILCFSKKFYSPVMWGHYSDNHKGLCLGFEVNRKTHPFNNFIPVEYKDEKVEINLNSEDLNDALIRYKCADWSYESEWRGWINLKNCTNISHDLFFYELNPKLELTEVIIGLRSDCTIEQIELALQGYFKKSETSTPVSLYQAEMSEYEFKMEKKFLKTIHHPQRFEKLMFSGQTKI